LASHVINPYAPTKRQIVVWAYFSLLVLFFFVGLVTFIHHGFQSTPRTLAFNGAILIMDLANIVGFFCFLKSWPLFRPFVWKFLASVLFVRLSMAIFAFGSNLIPWEASSEQFISLAGLVSILFGAPLAAALAVYGFHAPHIWKRQTRAA
jgi:hypothetical protein